MTETQAITLTPVPFYEDTLQVWHDDESGKDYVAPKPMVALFELTWEAQYRKLTSRSPFKEGIAVRAIPSAGGPQEAILLEQPLVHNWLITIPVSRVKPALQDKLLRYQRECAQALDDYFTHGMAVNPRFLVPEPLAPPLPAAPPPVAVETLRAQVELLERLVAMQEELDEARQQHIADLRRLHTTPRRGGVHGPTFAQGEADTFTTADVAALAAQIAAWLPEASREPFTATQLRVALAPTADPGLVRRACNRLVREGLLHRLRWGVYQRVEDEEATHAE